MGPRLEEGCALDDCEGVLSESMENKLVDDFLNTIGDVASAPIAKSVERVVCEDQLHVADSIGEATICESATSAKATEDPPTSVQDALAEEDATPEKAVADASSLAESQVFTPDKSTEGTGGRGNKDARIPRPGEWLDPAKQSKLLQAVADRFRAPLENNLQDTESCRTFWQKASELGMGLSIKEIPRRFRPQLKGQILDVFERRLTRWLQATSAVEDDLRMSTVMMCVLNDLIIAASGNPLPPALFGAAANRHSAVKQGVAKTHKRKQQISRKISSATPAVRRVMFSNDVEALVLKIATVLSKWHLACMKRDKGGLVTRVVQLASEYARALSALGVADMSLEVESRGEELGMLAFTIHKLVQLAPTLGAIVENSHSNSSQYFLRLSGGSRVQAELLCVEAVSASVDLLAKVWPKGFADFHSIEGMPRPPRPHHACPLVEVLCDDQHLHRYGEELFQRLMKEIDQGTDSLILQCACASVDNVLQVVKQAFAERGSANQVRSDRLRPQELEPVFTSSENSGRESSKDHPSIVSDEAPQVNEIGGGHAQSVDAEHQQLVHIVPPEVKEVSERKARKWIQVGEEWVHASGDRGSHRKRVRDHDRAEESRLLKVRKSNASDDDEDLPLTEAMGQPLQAQSDDEDLSLAALA